MSCANRNYRSLVVDISAIPNFKISLIIHWQCLISQVPVCLLDNDLIVHANRIRTLTLLGVPFPDVTVQEPFEIRASEKQALQYEFFEFKKSLN